MSERVARACAVHPWRTMAGWIVVLVVSFLVVAVLLGDALTGTGDVTTQTESKQANEILGERLDRGPMYSEVVVVRSSTLTVDEPGFRAGVDQLLAEGRATGVSADVRSYYEVKDESLVSADRRALIIPIGVGEDDIDALVGVVKSANGRDGFELGITGSETADADFETLSQEDLEHGELYFGAPAALVILLLVFGDTARRSAVVAILGLTAAGASAESGTPVSLTTTLALSPKQEGTR